MRGVLVVLAALLSGCNPLGALWLRIEAPLAVPEEADGVRVEVVRVEDGKVLYDAWHVLTDANAFPATLSLTTDDANSVGEARPLDVTVTALREDVQATAWSKSTARTELLRAEIRELVVRLCDCAVEE